MAWPPALHERVLQPELMDDPALDAAEHGRALRALCRLNRVSRAANILWHPIFELAGAPGHPPLRLLDIATGSGDLPVGLACLARRAAIGLEVSGVDVSQLAVETARARAARDSVEATFLRADALAEPLPGEFDIVTCSLFMHHLERDAAVELLYKMRCAATRMVLVSDLHRSRASYALAWAGGRIAGSRVAKVDALLSVRAAWTMDEFAAMAAEAGLEGAAIGARWPARFLLEWRRA
jgi:2-polyprenyl-3-methyl-5-hydroxy-6-metoxy-1,4-benzoquinol methylase